MDGYKALSLKPEILEEDGVELAIYYGCRKRKCELEFTGLHYLRVHYLAKHYCLECELFFARAPDELLEHNASVHDGIDKCHFCGVVEKDADHLAHHVLVHHRDELPLVLCSTSNACKFVHTETYVLKQHLVHHMKELARRLAENKDSRQVFPVKFFIDGHIRESKNRSGETVEKMALRYYFDTRKDSPYGPFFLRKKYDFDEFGNPDLEDPNIKAKLLDKLSLCD